MLALLQQLSLTEAVKAGEAEGEASQEKAKLPDLILAIEEPELYLHPSRSRFLSSVLERLAAIPADPQQARTQAIFATHSPYFIHMSEFDRLRLARKVPTAGIDHAIRAGNMEWQTFRVGDNGHITLDGAGKKS